MGIMKMEMQRAVKRLHFGEGEEKEKGIKEIKRIAIFGDSNTRKSLGELGVIQPLVHMIIDADAAAVPDAPLTTTTRTRTTRTRTDVDSESEVCFKFQKLALQTLIQLSHASFTNKMIMVESGILSKIPLKLDSLNESTKQDFAQLLLSISFLSTTKYPVNLSPILSPTITILESSSTIDTKLLCLTTLHNLSSVLENVGTMSSSTGIIDTLLKLSTLQHLSEMALLILSNISVTLAGRKALESNRMMPENLIEILTWEENQKCQELSVYILMVLAHQSFLQREKMAKAGILPILLEVALLSSPLAQKRALKLLQCFKDERQNRIGPHSGPQTGRVASMGLDIGSPVDKREAQEGKKLMKKIVEQSLQKNMDTIIRRASGAGVASRLKSLILSSSSKSLPY